MNRLIRSAFNQFYTTFAWTYDAVANLVSFGEWKEWGRAAISFLPRDGRVLEIGHGPGHLHLALHQQGYNAFGLDLSMQMCRMLRTRLTPLPASGEGLGVGVCASAMHLPFADGSFASVVSTFPSDYIFATATLRDVQRVLQPQGTFVIVPTARFTGDSLLVKSVELAYRLTGQRGGTSMSKIASRFASASFAIEVHTTHTHHAKVTMWVCRKVGNVQTVDGEQ